MLNFSSSRRHLLRRLSLLSIAGVTGMVSSCGGGDTSTTSAFDDDQDPFSDSAQQSRPESLEIYKKVSASRLALRANPEKGIYYGDASVSRNGTVVLREFQWPLMSSTFEPVAWWRCEQWGGAEPTRINIPATYDTLTISRDASRYFLHSPESVSVFDVSGRLLFTVPVSPPGDPLTMIPGDLVDAKGGAVYVAHSKANRLVIIELQTGAVILSKTLELEMSGSEVVRAAFAQNNELFFCISGNGSTYISLDKQRPRVTVFNVAGEYQRTILLQPYTFKFDPSDPRSDSEMWLVDQVTHFIMDTAGGMYFTTSRGTGLVNDEPKIYKYAPDGKWLTRLENSGQAYPVSSSEFYVLESGGVQRFMRTI